MVLRIILGFSLGFGVIESHDAVGWAEDGRRWSQRSSWDFLLDVA